MSAALAHRRVLLPAAPGRLPLHNEWRLALIAHYRDEVRAEMLGHIVCFGSAPVFQCLARELSEELCIDLVSASELLWPTSHEIYQAAVKAHE